MTSQIGLESVTIDQLASETKTSKNGLFAHFQSKENLQLEILKHAGEDFRQFVILPALQLKEMLEDPFTRYGVPLKVFRTIIDNYSQRFGYNLNKDNPVNLIQTPGNNVLIIHDAEDSVTSPQISRQMVKQNEQINLLETTGSGHSRILRNKAVVDTTLNFFSSHSLALLSPLNHFKN